jgi:hypothetical protein
VSGSRRVVTALVNHAGDTKVAKVGKFVSVTNTDLEYSSASSDLMNGCW